MTGPSAGEAAADAARRSYGRLLAVLASRSHDIAAAEDALGDAFAAALSHWPVDGVPAAPEAWLLTTARRRLLDGWRRKQVAGAAEATLLLLADEVAEDAPGAVFPDARLELLFVCAHPAIDAAARPALMLQTVLGLDVARMAPAFLVAPATLSQRLVRAKARIRKAGIPFEVPPVHALPERLLDVLEAVYAAFGTAWDDVAGADPLRAGLAREALELATTLAKLLPGSAEAWGLLALIAFCQARAAARRDANGDYVPLASQDIGRWDRTLIATAEAALRSAAAVGTIGPFQLEAAIQSAHTGRRLGARVPAEAIVALYDALVALHPTLGARVSRACAIGEARGPAAALVELDAIAEAADGDPGGPGVSTYQPFWAAVAHHARGAGDRPRAERAFSRAIGLASDPAVRRFLAL